MREIKFRFWMGNYAKPKYEYWDNLIKVSGDELIGRMLTEPYNPKVVIEQYTGIKDKNGLEIYVGDLFKIKHGYKWKKESYFEVIFSRSFGYILRNENGDWFPLKDKANGYEVIGNIHDKGEMNE